MADKNDKYGFGNMKDMADDVMDKVGLSEDEEKHERGRKGGKSKKATKKKTKK